MSSIGDIVLTSPVVRSLRKHLPEAEIHFLTRDEYRVLVEHDPAIDRVHVLLGSMSDTIAELKKEKFDLVFDLHKNLRSMRIKNELGVQAFSFPKLNIRKYFFTRFKINRMPDVHIVERYAAALEEIGGSLDDEGLALHMPRDVEDSGASMLRENLGDNAIAVVLGAKFGTKRYPVEYYADLLNKLGKPVLLMGGPNEKEDAKKVEKGLEIPCWNIVGELGLLESAACMKACSCVFTNDTGFMHIAAAFKMKVYSVWGNTVPAFGMYPYKTESLVIEVENLSCRPCSKIGYDKCPKGHFKCMKELTPAVVLQRIKEFEKKKELTVE